MAQKERVAAEYRAGEVTVRSKRRFSITNYLLKQSLGLGSVAITSGKQRHIGPRLDYDFRRLVNANGLKDGKRLAG